MNRSSLDVKTTTNSDGDPRSVAVIDRPNTLKQKLNGPEVGAGIINADAIAKAEAAIADSRDHYLAHATKHVTAMREASTALKKNRKAPATPLKTLGSLGREMKGQAATFDFQLLSRFGDSLYELTKQMTHVSDRQVELIDAHLDAIDVVISQKIMGLGGSVGDELCNGLRRAIQRVVADNRR
ncbi:MAG: hypothetical protein AAF213_00885 [Pseudomonadota bacterium]